MSLLSAMLVLQKRASHTIAAAVQSDQTASQQEPETEALKTAVLGNIMMQRHLKKIK